MEVKVPDGMEATVEETICEFHKDNPGVPYAGCTCSKIYKFSRKRSKKKADKRVS